MGGLISVLAGNSNEASVPDVIIDLQRKLGIHYVMQGAEPSPDELALYNHATLLLKPTNNILHLIKSYSGCGDLIRMVI